MKSLVVAYDPPTTHTAPSGGVTVDVPVMIGALCVIPVSSEAVGDKFAGYARGEFRLPKNVGTSFSAGDLVEWDVSAGELITPGTVEDDIEIGYCRDAAGSADTEVVIVKDKNVPAVNAGG